MYFDLYKNLIGENKINAKRVKIALVAVFAFMLLGATMVSASSNVYFDFKINRGTVDTSWGTKDDYAAADVNFKANSNWQQGQEYFLARLITEEQQPVSITHTVHYAGLFNISYNSGYSSPGTRGLLIGYSPDQPYSNATAYGVWAP